MQEQKKFNAKNLLLIIAAVVIILVIVFSGRSVIEKIIPGKDFKKGGGKLPLSGDVNSGNVSPISGIPCENYNKRSIAVMVASDTINRPLSGLSQADLIVEMPVLMNDVTRLMAVYVCGEPEEVGSVRSARHDYLWFSLSLDSILAHWGGSYHVLNLLKLDQNINKIADNIDALQNPFNAYWRKDNLPAPYNGFTSIKKLRFASEKLKFRQTNKFEGYPHGDEIPLVKRPESGVLSVGYPGSMAVRYDYDKNTNSYLRVWGGTPDTDFNNGKRIAAKNVVIMRADERLAKPGEQYNDVDVEGEGNAEVYQNGGVIKGTWKKDIINKQSKLYFYNSQGEEVKYVPGQIWIEVVPPDRRVTWAAIP